MNDKERKISVQYAEFRGGALGNEIGTALMLSRTNPYLKVKRPHMRTIKSHCDNLSHAPLLTKLHSGNK